MDKCSRRDRARKWIAVGVREGLTFKALAARSGFHERTLRRWNHVFRDESAANAQPDQEEDAFVELLERVASKSDRIEVVLPDERRMVIDGSRIVEAVVRVIAAVERC